MIMAPGLLAFLQASFFLFLTLLKLGLFCFNNELAALKQKQESGFGFSLRNAPKFPRESTAL